MKKYLGSLMAVFLFVAMLLPSGSFAASCLTNPAAPGGGVLGATVQTFMNLGINPNNTCIQNSLWTDPSGFSLGSYVQGANGLGGSPNPAVLAWNGANLGSFAANANQRDFFWVQDTGNSKNFGNGIFGGSPSQGMIWDLGGQANQAVVFVQVDHGPLPGEVLENTAWLSNNPNAPDAGWVQAELVDVFLQGWSPNPNIVDGFVPVYRLPNNQTFRYVSITHGGPGAVRRDGDNEIDAVGGLTVSGQGLGTVPEPSGSILLVLGIAGLAFLRTRKASLTAQQV